MPGPARKLIFASVKKDGVEIMYQTRARSLPTIRRRHGADWPQRGALHHRSVLRDLDTIERQTQGAPVVKARHDTFYGTTEFYIRESGSNVVGFCSDDLSSARHCSRATAPGSSGIIGYSSGMLCDANSTHTVRSCMATSASTRPHRAVAAVPESHPYWPTTSEHPG